MVTRARSVNYDIADSYDRRMEQRHLELPSNLSYTDTVAALEQAGCLNPTDRALDLAHSGTCRFYRPFDDAIVIVTSR